ncbi:hypothetical protein LTR08_006392 [Meristemomyces frigidus]|nr:hypothetical protein LTR08_006392 [Meristemomyces frigidus]
MNGGMGLTGGFADVGGLYDCMYGIYAGRTDDSILDKYDEVRRKKFREVIDPISCSNLRRLWNPEAIEQDDFIQMVKRAETDKKFAREMSGGMRAVMHDFTQYYQPPSNCEDELLAGKRPRSDRQLETDELDENGEAVIGFEQTTLSWGGRDSHDFKLIDLDMRFKVGQLNVVIGPTPVLGSILVHPLRAPSMDSATLSGAFGATAVYVAAPFVGIALLLVLVRVYTTWSYYHSLKQFAAEPRPGMKTVRSPQIPYTLPFLGNTLSFLMASYPGQFWSELFAWHPRNTGVCSLLIGGHKTHILFSTPAVEALFKARSPAKGVFERDLFKNVFAMSDEQIQNAADGKHFEHEMNTQYLTKRERVNELTAHFTRVLQEVLDRDAEEIVKLEDIGLYEWLRDRMFTASTTALLGEKLLQMYPEYCEDFYKFDYWFLSFFFQLPKFLMADAYKCRDRLITNLEAWGKEMHRLSGGTPVDPEGPAWEPFFGSRLSRARQLDYKNRNLNSRSSAAFDLGITFGLSSNVIPATGWMLMHILDPNGDRSILPRVLVELRRAENEDGSLDIATLMSQPLLQSIWTETLRLYTDVLVARNLPEDLTLPLSEDGTRQVVLPKGGNVFAPCWLAQHDDKTWSGRAPYNAWYAERFVSQDPETGKEYFSMSGTVGKFFPFGGGKSICPGRVFAKQEGLGAVAMMLLRFDFEVTGFVDERKKPTASFPGYAKACGGSGALVPGGDMKVKVRRRDRSG